MPMHPDLANKMKIGGDRPGGDATEQPQHDNSQGVLERAMANTNSEPELGAQVNRSDEAPVGTKLHADGTVETWRQGVMQGSSADVATGVDVFKSIVSANGDQRISIHDADMESRVTLQNGMEMTIRSALEAGFISQDGEGSFKAGPVDSSAEVEKAPEDQDLDPTDAGEFLPPADEAVMQELIDNTSAHDQVSIINDITSGNGMLDEHTINRAASEAGLDPAVMHGKIESVAGAMRTQASAAVAKHGVDPEAVWSHFNEPANLPKLQAAVREHAMTRSTASYNVLAQEYVENLDTIDPEAILSADFGGQGKAHRDANGKIVVTDANGTTYTWKSAVKAGIIKLS